MYSILNANGKELAAEVTLKLSELYEGQVF